MDDEHRQDFGQMPGINDAPLNASFRDGPAKEPRRIRWWEPLLIITGAAGVFIVLIVMNGK
ncbi:hypothetical protein [Leifsonia sp. Leaf264]|uniref:hypothetical protein n=1 Tax=Leifsonia sp. Leaf264 TaxID=1736314 RepID=UPI0012F812D7|nr:hypothetical protein [Leifsonia sp. Leaf264]